MFGGEAAAGDGDGDRENVFLVAKAANFAREQIEGRAAPLRGHLIAIPKTADNETFG